MLVLMREDSQWVSVPKFLVVLELQAFKVENTKKVSFSKEKRKLKYQQLEFPKPLKISEPKLMEKLSTLVQAIEKKVVDLT